MDRSSIFFGSFSILVIVVCILCMFSCGSTEIEGEDYGDLLDSPSGLVLTEDEHVNGWGRTDCLMCHALNNIHLVDRSGLGVDVDAIREQTYIDGESGCAACHGANGT